MKELIIAAVAICSLAPVLVAAAEKQATFRGTCMGTKYAVTVVDRPAALSLESLAAHVSDELERIEQIFSLYRPSSELSRLNAAASGEWVAVSSDLLAVTKRSLELATATDGAFDPTVGPLMKLWRLHQVSNEWSPPTREAIAETKQRVSWRLIDLRDDPPSLRKLSGGVELDLNALVEGWAIDCVSQILIQKRIQHALIELGGEFRGLGRKADGQPWRIAIENPLAAGTGYATVTLADAALSTSGNYRDSIQYQSQRYGHVLDARRGEPVQHDLVAVSVIADDALSADGWATALLVLGPVQGLALAEKQALAASFVTRNSHKIILSSAAKARITLQPRH